MAAPNTAPIFELTPTVKGLQFTSADTTTKKSLQTGGANSGTRVDAIWCSTNDTTAVDLLFYINTGSTDYFIGSVNVPIGSGYPGVARVNAMPTLAPVLGYIYLPTSYILKVACEVTMTAAKTTDVVAMGGDY